MAVLLAAKRWTQRDLAARLHIDPALMTHLLAGRLAHRRDHLDLWKRVWITLTSSSSAVDTEERG